MLTGNYNNVTRMMKNWSDVIDGLRMKKIQLSRKWDNLEDYSIFLNFVQSFGFHEEYVEYLCKCELKKQLEQFICKDMPSEGHRTIPVLIDNNMNDESLQKSCVSAVKGKCDLAKLKKELRLREADHLIG